MTSPTDHLVRVSRDDGVTWLTLDSPTNRNALSSALIDQLLTALRDAAADDSVRVIVLTHTGPVFCSGADLTETAAAFAAATGTGDATPAGGRMPAARLGEVLAAIWESPKPVIARVAGPVRAGGIGLVAAADIAVCAREATFAFTEVRIGVIPAVISATVLRRLTGRAAADLYLTGRTFDAVEAAANGLVTSAVPAEALDAAVSGYLDALRRGAPGALAGAKHLLHHQDGVTFRDTLARLSTLSVQYFHSEEGMEGIRAFAAKRRPSWSPPG